ncbi:hypothetical protein SDC9_102599 [bioreactor metagenome]|uniref:Uncharacterized protein n=1 Tax=bioreactor metagenome TaxID=1076179 RepID=A0A645ARB1_9ZZZZ
MEELSGDKKELLTRIAVCVVAALVLYYILDEASEKVHLDILVKYRPWLKENKVQAIAVIAAVLFGLSLAMWPMEEEKINGNEPHQGPHKLGD